MKPEITIASVIIENVRFIPITELEEAKNVARRLLRERDEARGSLAQYDTVLRKTEREVIEASKERDEARANHKSAEDDLDNLAVKIREARQNGIHLREERDILQSQVNHLESDWDALAKQVDELRAVIEIPKWGGWNSLPHCPWCLRTGNHAYNCPRQKALGKE